MPSGIIELYTYSGESIKSVSYDSADHRKRIMKGWEQIYGNKFRSGYVHIIPNEKELLLNENGTNATQRSKKNDGIMNLKGKSSAATIASKYNVHISRVYAVHSGRYKNTCG